MYNVIFKIIIIVFLKITHCTMRGTKMQTLATGVATKKEIYYEYYCLNN